MATDDHYSIETNGALTADAGENDTFNASWDDPVWTCLNTEYHDAYWEHVTEWNEGWWEEPVWYEAYDDENGEYHAAHWDPVSPVWHEGYTSEWDVWHDAGWDCVEEGWQSNIVDASISITSDPDHGSVELAGDGINFTFTPDPGYSGNDSFTYNVRDNESGSDATVTIAVNPAGNPPIAAPDSFTTDEDTSLTIAQSDLLTNDSDADGDELTALIASQPAHGTVNLSPNGDLLYTPDANYSGADSFTYFATDGNGWRVPATVTLAIDSVADRPTVAGAGYFMTSGNSLVIDAPGLLAVANDGDGDALTAALVSQASHGSATVHPDGSFSYTPAAGYHGADTFTFAASDGQLTSDPATASVTVLSATGPQTQWDSYTAAKNVPFIIGAPGVLQNDSDPDHRPLNAIKASDPLHGGVSLGSDGRFTYTPAAGFAGWDYFTYQAYNGYVYSSATTAWIKVGSPPAAVADSYTMVGDDGSLVVSSRDGVRTNDRDFDGDPFTASRASDPSHGTVTLGPYGDFTYTPDAGFSGTDSYTYVASDGQETSGAATVTIRVLPVNQSLVAADDSFVSPATVRFWSPPAGVLANDASPVGSSLAPLLVTPPAHGYIGLQTDGSYYYDPDWAYTGTDSFTYRATDGQAASNLATVSIDVRELTDIALTNFYSDGTDLKIEYLIYGTYSPFNITVYASPDGTTLGTPLEVRAGDGSWGLNTLTISPTFDDPRDDYYLVAKIDSDDAVTEYSEDNNTALFQKGAFIVHEATSGQTVLHIAGSDAADPVSVASTGTDNWQVLMPRSSVAVPAGASPPPYYDVTGNGIVNDLDIAAVQRVLSGPAPNWQNYSRFDVTYDFVVTPADALVIINALNATGERMLTSPHTAHDFWYDVNGDGVLSVVDANETIDVINGGSGAVGAPWRNPSQPFDVNNDGAVNIADTQTIQNYLSLGEIDYTALALDQIHIRTHGGDDAVAADGAITWLFGGDDDNTLTGGACENYLAAGDGDNTITGGSGPNTIEVGDGNNTIAGGNGNDSISVGNGNNSVNGGTGDDSIDAGDGDNEIDGGDGDDTVTTGDGSNTIDGGDGDDCIYTGGTDNDIDGGTGYNDIYDGESDSGGDHNLLVDIDWHRVADIGKDNGNDERDVVVTLAGPDGLSMSEVRSIYGRGQTGIQSIQFPLFDPDTDYTLTVTPSDGLTGGGSMTFNSSSVTYAANGTYEVMYEVLSTGVNYDENGELPDGYPLPSPDANPVSGGEDEYSTLAGQTLTVNAVDGVLVNDVDGDRGALDYASADISWQPLHGTVSLAADGSFSYTPSAGFWGIDLFRYVVHGVSGTSLMAMVYVKVLNFKYVALKTWVDDHVTPQSPLRDSQMVADDEKALQARIKQAYRFDYIMVIPRNPLQDRMPGRTYGTSGFVIGVKGGYKGTDFSKLTVTLVPYAILYAEGGPVKIHFPGGPLHPEANEEEIWDGPTSTKDHELWHTEGEPQWVQDKVKIRLNNQDPVTGVGYVVGFNREMAKIATDLGASNAAADALYRQLLDKIQLALVPIHAGGPWHTTSTKAGAMFDIIIG